MRVKATSIPILYASVFKGLFVFFILLLIVKCKENRLACVLGGAWLIMLLLHMLLFLKVLCWNAALAGCVKKAGKLACSVGAERVSALFLGRTHCHKQKLGRTAQFCSAGYDLPSYFVTCTDVDMVLPAASRATARMVWAPFALLRVFQL